MGLFNKKTNCTACSIEIDKNNTYYFCQNQDQFGNPDSMCKGCFDKAVEKSLINFQSKAVSVEPLIKDKNRKKEQFYHFYEISNFPKYAFEENDKINVSKYLSEIKDKCDYCEKAGQYLFCSSEVNDHEISSQIEYKELPDSKTLCNECMAKYFLEKINNSNTITVNGFIGPKNEPTYSSNFDIMG